MTRRGEVIACVLGLIAFLWLGNEHGWAVMIFLVGGLVWLVDVSIFEGDKCWCQGGKVYSPLSGTFTRHKACGGSGERPRLAHRLWRKHIK